MALMRSRTISKLGIDDIPFLMSLTQEQNWAHTERDWRTMLLSGHTFGHRQGDDDGGSSKNLLSCAHFTEYGPAFASLGMLLVSKSSQKQGLAASLLKHILSKNTSKHHQRPIGLITATKAQDLYPKFGFQFTGEHILKLKRPSSSGEGFPSSSPGIGLPHGCRLQPVSTPCDIDRIIRFDGETTELDRSQVLKELLNASDEAFIVEDSTSASLAGYGVAKIQGDLLTVGPVVAMGNSIASTIFHELTNNNAAHPKVKTTRIDLFENQQELAHMLTSSAVGYRQVDRQPVMVNYFGHQESGYTLPGNRGVMFCPASQAWL